MGNKELIARLKRRASYETAEDPCKLMMDAARALEAALSTIGEPVAEIVSAHGDPEAFGARELVARADIQKLAYGTKLYSASPALSAQVQEVAVQDVVDELRRQVEVEGWSAAHDDTHDKGEMAGAAACYALAGVTYVAPDHYPPRKRYAAVVDARNSIPEKERETTREAIKVALGEPSAPKNWPWQASWWKPTDTRRNIVKAAALLISEIKRIDRAAAPVAKQGEAE